MDVSTDGLPYSTYLPPGRQIFRPALEALAHSYYSETEELREEIVHVLAENGGPVAIQLLLAALQDDSAVIRELAREHLRSH